MSKSVKLGYFIIALALALPGVFALQYLERLGCPADAFICGSASAEPHTLAGFARVLLVMLFLAYPANILLYFATRNRLLREKFAGEFKRFDIRTKALRAAVIAALVMPALYLSTYEKIWASPDVIFERKYVWSAPVTRSWSDVVAVFTRCVPGSRGAWNTGYYLIFRDRSYVDLSVHAGPIAKQKAPIFAALHGGHFEFDASAVDKDCIPGFREMATLRPDGL